MNAREILAITEAVRAAVDDAIAGRCPAAVAVTRAVAAAVGQTDEAVPAERPAERYRRQNCAALAQIAELERQGRARAAAAIVARRLASDPNDPAEIETLSQRFRRLRRRQK